MPAKRKAWPAAVFATVILGTGIYQSVRRAQTVDDSARFAIGVSLVREYQGTELRRPVREYSKQRTSGATSEELPPSALPIPMVELLDAKARGSKEAMVAKVKVAVNGGAPPDGRGIRYLNLRRSRDGRWLVVGDSDAYQFMIRWLLP